MAIEIQIHVEKNMRFDAVLVDLMSSASYFGEKEIDFEKYGDGVAFVFQGHCPNEYLEYLTLKYDASFNYVDKWILEQQKQRKKN